MSAIGRVHMCACKFYLRLIHSEFVCFMNKIELDFKKEPRQNTILNWFQKPDFREKLPQTVLNSDSNIVLSTTLDNFQLL